MARIEHSYILRPDGTRREVKNLGWLLAHRNEVQEFRVRTRVTLPEGTILETFRALLSARVVIDGREYVYTTPYADTGILRRFLARPSWIDLRCYWNDLPYTITKKGPEPVGR